MYKLGEVDTSNLINGGTYIVKFKDLSGPILGKYVAESNNFDIERADGKHLHTSLGINIESVQELSKKETVNENGEILHSLSKYYSVSKENIQALIKDILEYPENSWEQFKFLDSHSDMFLQYFKPRMYTESDFEKISGMYTLYELDFLDLTENNFIKLVVDTFDVDEITVLLEYDNIVSMSHEYQVRLEDLQLRSRLEANLIEFKEYDNYHILGVDKMVECLYKVEDVTKFVHLFVKIMECIVRELDFQKPLEYNGFAKVQEVINSKELNLDQDGIDEIIFELDANIYFKNYDHSIDYSERNRVEK